MRLPITIVLGMLLLSGCTHVNKGGTILDVRADNESEEARIRRELYRVDKALEAVKFRYGMGKYRAEVIVTTMGGLAATEPALEVFRVDGAVVTLNKIVLLDPQPDTDDIMLGLMAHELSHGLHYERISDYDLAILGEKYGRYIEHQSKELEPWVKAYEQLTDMTAIKLGYADALVKQKAASQANLAHNHPAKVWNFYLTEDEIRAYDADPAALEKGIDERLKVVGLSSLHFLKKKPVFDEYGALIDFE